mmetsp:Transcript_81474/g.141482  ORF Transcript_81474/g.141482 Transcript_81474/m.141482 type:complete len:266 (-) Transcript_81474:686-1483(-)
MDHRRAHPIASDALVVHLEAYRPMQVASRAQHSLVGHLFRHCASMPLTSPRLVCLGIGSACDHGPSALNGFFCPCATCCACVCHVGAGGCDCDSGFDYGCDHGCDRGCDSEFHCDFGSDPVRGVYHAGHPCCRCCSGCVCASLTEHAWPQQISVWVQAPLCLIPCCLLRLASWSPETWPVPTNHPQQGDLWRAHADMRVLVENLNRPSVMPQGQIQCSQVPEADPFQPVQRQNHHHSHYAFAFLLSPCHSRRNQLSLCRLRPCPP